METMRAHVFRGIGQSGIERLPIPKPSAGDALVRITLTTICGTDLHIVRGEYPVKPGLVIGTNRSASSRNSAPVSRGTKSVIVS